MDQGDTMGGCYAWVTLATNDSYSLGALVLAHSLRKSNTKHKLVALITPMVSQTMVKQLQTVFDLVEVVSPILSNDEARLALMKRPELGVTFTKIHCWKLLQFEKCVFLDADTFVVRNCDELFEREEFSAAPDVGWPDCFNSGVFVYKPSIETFNKLSSLALREGSFDGGDQGLLNQFFSDWATEDIKKHLPFVYNLTTVATYSYIPAFRHYGAETRIVHFIGTEKPWLQYLDPVTRTVMPTPGSEHLVPFLQQWWDVFCEKVHPILKEDQENSNDGMHPPVEACSNTPVALTSDELQPPRFIEPCLQYIEKDDYRQQNLPYQPFDVRGSSGELLNVDFFIASVVPPDHVTEQQGGDGNEVEEKNVEPKQSQEKISDKSTEQEEPNDTTEKRDDLKSDIADENLEEKKEEAQAPKDPFDYNTFFPDEKCVNNYLEQNVVTYQPYETLHQDSESKDIQLPRFLTLPEDDQRQKGNIKVVEHQPAPEPPPPPLPPPSAAVEVTTTTTTTTTTTETSKPTQQKAIESQREPTPPAVEKLELTKSKSMTFIPGDVIATDVCQQSLPQRSIWKSQPNVNVDLNRKYSMPKLKPILPRQNSKSIQSPVPRVTLYTEFLMSADYKDPEDLPKDKVGFVETELRRSKSEADLKGRFGPLPYTKSPEVAVPEPAKPPLRELDNEAFDLTRCKRQIGNKPRNHKKENVTSKPITPSKEKISTVIKKRKSKELSPGDGAKEKPIKKERKERQKKNENLDEILKRLWEFSKHYQHYFGVNAQNEMKERPIQSEFKQFRNFVKDQKESSQKGLWGIKDIMIEKMDVTKMTNGNTNCIRDVEVSKMVNGRGKFDNKNAVITPNSEVKEEREKYASVKQSKILKQSPGRCKISNEKPSDQCVDQVKPCEPCTDRLTQSENILIDQNGIKTSDKEFKTNVENVERDNISEKYQGVVVRENKNNQNGWSSQTDKIKGKYSIENIKAKETFTQNEKNDAGVLETSKEWINFPKAPVKSPLQLNVPKNTEKDVNLPSDIVAHSDSNLSTIITKQSEKTSTDTLNESKSQLTTPTAPNMRTEGIENSVLTKIPVGVGKDTERAIEKHSTNAENSKLQEDEKIKEPSLEKVDNSSEHVKTQSLLSSLKNHSSTVGREVKNDKRSTTVLGNEIYRETENKVQSQKLSEKLKVLQEDTVTLNAEETNAEASKVPVANKPKSSEITLAQKSVTQKITNSKAPIEESTPKGMFTVGSPDKSTNAHEKFKTQPKGDLACSSSSKQTEEVPQTSKVGESIHKPDEILCVPDFETPRSSRILTPIPIRDIDKTPQASTSSPINIPRKARIQRKPYENGRKYRSSAGKKALTTGSGKNVPGLAGAIAKLKLQTSGEAAESNDGLAAHQEYLRRKNWETGNIDYMGKDSFENIWSKICQTLEEKELDKATDGTQSLMKMSTEEKTKTERAAGAEEPVSLSMILEKCPESIQALPSEPVTGPVEDDEIIFSKSETRQKCLTNITEEEENCAASEGVSLSDILKPNKVMEPPRASEGVANSQLPTITPSEVHLNKKLPEEPKADEKPQPTTDASTQQVQGVPCVTVPSPLAKEMNEPLKPQTPITGTFETQLDENLSDIKTGKPECTTVAVCQPLLIPGGPTENLGPAKKSAQKIAEKKFQQNSETPTEPIPLPAPESPTRNECKTVAVLQPPVIPTPRDEKETPVKETAEPAPPAETATAKAVSKEESQKKGVFSKLLEMVGVSPKVEEVSKSVFYDEKQATPITEVADAKPSIDVQEIIKESQPVMGEDEPKAQETEKIPDPKVETGSGIEQATTLSGGEQKLPEKKEELKSSISETEKPTSGGAKKTPGSGSRKPGQATMPKPARNASPRSSTQASKNKSPSPLSIPQTPPETELTMATPTPPPDPPKRRNSALLKVDESIPLTPPVAEPQKGSSEPVKSEVEDIIEKAKTEVESILKERRSVEKEASESSELIETMKLMVGAEAQAEVEELKVTSEEERQRHKGEVVSSKLSDQILKAIPPPRRKAISESKSEASGSSGAIPKAATPAGEKPKHKPSSIPVPPPRNKGKASTAAPTKGKTKK